MEFVVDPGWFSEKDKIKKPLRAHESVFNLESDEPETADAFRPAQGLFPEQPPELNEAEESSALSLALGGYDLNQLYPDEDEADETGELPSESRQLPEMYAENGQLDDAETLPEIEPQTLPEIEPEPGENPPQSVPLYEAELDPVFANAINDAASEALGDDFDLQELFKPSTVEKSINARAVQAQAEYLKDVNLSDIEKYARLKNIPVETAAYASEQSRQEAIAQAIAENDNLAKWAAKSPLNSRLAVDNIEQASRICQVFQTQANFGSIKKKFQEYGGLPELGRDLWLGIYDSAATALPSFFNGCIDILKSFYAIPLSGVEIIAQDSALAGFLREGVQAVDRLKLEAPKPHGVIGNFSKLVWENAPQLVEQWALAGLGMAASAAKAAAAGQTVSRANQIAAGVRLSGWAMFSNIYGLSYLQNRELGASPGNASFMAGVNALLQMRMENMGLHAIFGQEIGKKTAGAIARAGLRSAGIEGVTEAAQEVPESLTRKWAEATTHYDSFGNRFAYFTQEILDWENFKDFCADAFLSGLVGSALGGPAGAIHRAVAAETPAIAEIGNDVTERVFGITERVALQASLDQAIASASQSPAAINGDISGLRALVEQTLPAEAKELFIDPEDLNQLRNLHGPVISQVFNMEDAEIESAIANNEILQVSASDIIAAAAMPNLSTAAKEAANRARQNSTGPNFIESKNFDPVKAAQSLLGVFYNTGTVDEAELTALFGKDGLARLRLDEAQDQRDKQSRLNAELNNFQKQLLAEGTLTNEAGRKLVRLYRAYALHMSDEFGIDPVEFFRRLIVEHGGAPVLDANGQPILGAVAFNATSTVMRFFDGANLITTLHESGHNFFEHTVRIAQDNGRIAFATLYNGLPGFTRGQQDIFDTARQRLDPLAHGQTTDYEAEIKDFTDFFKKESEATSQQLRNLRLYLQQQQQALANTSSPLTGNLTQTINDTNQKIDELEARRGAYNRLVYHGRRASQRMENIQKAKDALKTFADYAGVDLAEAQDAIRILLDHQTRTLNDPTYDPTLNKLLIDDARATYTKIHEAVANGFTDYMHKGEAPSAELAGLFGRMRGWLKKLFGARQAFGPALNPEVEKAFSRWFAEDEAINAMAPFGGQIARGVIQMANIPQADLNQLNLILQNMDQQRSKLIAQIHEETRKFEARTGPAIRQQMNQEAFWYFLKHFSISEAWCKTEIGRKKTKILKRVCPELFDTTGKRDIGDADLHAMGLPRSPSMMLSHLYQRLVIQRETFDNVLESRLAAESAQFFQGKMAALANHDAKTLGQSLPTANRVALRKMMADHFQTSKDLEAWIDKVQTPPEVLTAQAQKLLAGKPLSQLKPRAMQREVQRWIAMRDAAVKNDDVPAAMQAMNGLNLANAMFFEATKLRMQAEHTRLLIKKICQSKPGYYDADIMEAMRKVIEGYKLGTLKQPVDNARAAKSLREMLFALNDDIISNYDMFSDWLLDGENPLFDPNQPESKKNKKEPPDNFEAWTPEIINEFEGFLSHMLYHAQRLRKEKTGKDKAAIGFLAETIAGRLNLLPPISQSANHVKRALASLLRGGAAWSNSLVVICRWIDGFVNPTGAGQALEMEQMGLEAVQCERRTHQRMDNLTRNLMPHIHTLQATIARLEQVNHGKEVRVTDAAGNLLRAPELIRQTYGVEGIPPGMLLAMALNLGNESNIRRLVAGYPDLTFEHFARWFGGSVALQVMNAVQDSNFKPLGTASLTEEGVFKPADWKAIQGVWDVIGSQWDDIAAVHEKVQGFKPAQIMPAAFTAICDGKPIQMKGGYFPVKFDPNISQDINQLTDKDLARFRLDNIAQRPCPKRGFTLQRVKETHYPLWLSFDIVGEHINDTCRYIEFAEILRKMDRVTNHAALTNAIKRVLGNEFMDNVRPALARCVLKEPARTPLAKLNRMVRPYFVTYALGLNLRVALMQPMAIFSAMRDVGPKYILRAMNYIARNGYDAINQIAQVSTYYRDRVYSWDQDLQRHSSSITDNPSKTWVYKGREFSWRDIADAALCMIQWMDQFATAVVFLAGYMRHMEQAGQPVDLKGANLAQTFAMMGKSVVSTGKKLIPRPSEFYWDPADAPERLTRQEIRERKINAYQPLHKMFDTFNSEHAAAVAKADQFVKDSNPDFDATSTTRFGTDQGIASVINPFSSATTQLTSRFFTMFNAWRKGQVKGIEVFKTIGFDTLLPTIYMMTLFGLARGYLKDDKPDESYKFILSTLMENASVMVPMVGRPFTDVILSGFNANSFKGRRGADMSINFPFQVAQDAATAVGKLAFKKDINKKDQEQIMRAICEIIDVFSRFPILKNYWKYKKAEDQRKKGKGTWASAITPR